LEPWLLAQCRKKKKEMIEQNYWAWPQTSPVVTRYVDRRRGKRNLPKEGEVSGKKYSDADPGSVIKRTEEIETKKAGGYWGS